MNNFRLHFAIIGDQIVRTSKIRYFWSMDAQYLHYHFATLKHFKV